MDAWVLIVGLVVLCASIAAALVVGFRTGLDKGTLRQQAANTKAIGEAEDRAIAAKERELEREKQMLAQLDRLKRDRDQEREALKRQSDKFVQAIRTDDIENALNIYDELNAKLTQDVDKIVLPVPPKEPKT